jgi:hypothetical protein
MTQNASNMRPFPPPSSYHPDTWEIGRRYIAAANATSMTDLMILSPVGEGKTDTNNKGPLSTDCVGCRCHMHGACACVCEPVNTPQLRMACCKRRSTARAMAAAQRIHAGVHVVPAA